MQEARNLRITRRNPDSRFLPNAGCDCWGGFCDQMYLVSISQIFLQKPVSSPFEGQVSLFSQIFLVCENKRPGFPTLQDEGFQMPFTTYVQ
jgi:hypothetical protein